jgi:type II secretory pathway pseudopilin PulG
MLTRRGEPAPTAPRREDGFSLIELIIAIGLLGVVFSVLALVVVTAMTTNRDTRERLDETRDEQLVAAYFASDVAGATAVVAGGTSQCGSGPALVEVRGESFAPGTPPTASDTRATYVFTTATVDGVATGTLTRRFCESTSAPPYATPNRTTTVAQTLAATPPVVTCSTGGVAGACSDDTTTMSVRFERLSGDAPFVLSATRRTSAP